MKQQQYSSNYQNGGIRELVDCDWSCNWVLYGHYFDGFGNKEIKSYLTKIHKRLIYFN